MIFSTKVEFFLSCYLRKEIVFHYHPAKNSRVVVTSTVTCPNFTLEALETVDRKKATYEKTAKDIKVKHTAQKNEMMKTLTDGISKILNEKTTEVDKVYDPACQKHSVQAETVTNYLEKVEKYLHRTNDLLKNSKLQELIAAQKRLNVDIQMLQNARPQNLTSFQVQIPSPVLKDYLFM